MSNDEPTSHDERDVTPLSDEQESDQAAALPEETHPSTPAAQRPTVWPVFVAYVAAALLGVLGSVIVVVVVVIVLVAGGADATQAAGRFEREPLLMLLSLMPMQIVLAAAVLITAGRKRRPLAASLGLVPPRLGPSGWAMVLIGSGVPFAAAIGAASLAPSLMGSPENITEMWRTMPPGVAVLWVLMIGAAPGFCEELFFRGLMQRRLLAAWRPGAAIGVTSLLFALLHIDPPAMTLALVLGVWLGFVAWRTGSILPTMAIHALINSGWNALQIVARQYELPDSVWVPALVVFGVAAAVCFVGAIRVLIRKSLPFGMRPVPVAPGL